MNAKSCAMIFKKRRGTDDPISLYLLSEIYGVPRKDIARAYRELVKRK